jgi:Phosphate-starvation-inducible E family
LFRLYTPANEATTGCRQGSSGYWDLKREHTLIKALVKWQMLSEQWWRLTVFQQLESAIALVLTVILGLVTLVVLYRLAVEVTNGLLLGALNPLDRAVFQAVFGEIMTVLIALEFNHTLLYVATREQSIIQI